MGEIALTAEHTQVYYSIWIGVSGLHARFFYYKFTRQLVYKIINLVPNVSTVFHFYHPDANVFNGDLLVIENIEKLHFVHLILI